MMPVRTLGRRTAAVVYGLACHVLFATGVGLMIWQMHAGMARGFGTLAPPWSLIANGLLLVQFPLAHSALLTRRGQSLLRRLAPAAVARDLVPTSYVILASAQTLLLFAAWSPSGIVWWRAEGVMLAALDTLYAASWLLLVRAIWDAGPGLQTGTIGWTALWRGERVRYPPMPSTGLFRLCRQPIYLAFTATVWTVPVWTPDQLAVALVLSGYCLSGPLLKEARFARQFGAEFARYRASHRYFLPLPRGTARRNDLSIYDAYADRWWDGSVRWLRTLQNLVPARLAHFDRTTSWRGKTVLDLGCGGGFMAEALADRGAIVTGIDPSAAALAIAAAHAAAGGKAIGYICAAGERLPLPGEAMDVVVSVDVLEHVADLDAVLAEVARVLKPGGIFVFDTINRTWLARLVIVSIAEGLLRLLPRGTHDPAKFIPPHDLAARLERLGFRVEPAAGLGPRGLTRRLDFRFGPMPFTAVMYMSRATKTGAHRPQFPA